MTKTKCYYHYYYNLYHYHYHHHYHCCYYCCHYHYYFDYGYQYDCYTCCCYYGLPGRQRLLVKAISVLRVLTSVVVKRRKKSWGETPRRGQTNNCPSPDQDHLKRLATVPVEE